jgi:hypothetical protein
MSLQLEETMPSRFIYISIHACGPSYFIKQPTKLFDFVICEACNDRVL